MVPHGTYSVHIVKIPRIRIVEEGVDACAGPRAAVIAIVVTSTSIIWVHFKEAFNKEIAINLGRGRVLGFIS